mgnify:CR=1 FL=1
MSRTLNCTRCADSSQLRAAAQAIADYFRLRMTALPTGIDDLERLAELVQVALGQKPEKSDNKAETG